MEKETRAAEVTDITNSGFEVLVDGEMLVILFCRFPWLAAATVEQLINVQRPAIGHLRWPQLDVDISVDSIRRPGDFPLVSGLGQQLVIAAVGQIAVIDDGYQDGVQTLVKTVAA